MLLALWMLFFLSFQLAALFGCSAILYCFQFLWHLTSCMDGGSWFGLDPVADV